MHLDNVRYLLNNFSALTYLAIDDALQESIFCCKWMDWKEHNGDGSVILSHAIDELTDKNNSTSTLLIYFYTICDEKVIYDTVTLAKYYHQQE